MKTTQKSRNSVITFYGLVLFFPLLAILGCSSWDINGNSGINPDKNFLGTIEEKPIIIKVDNMEAMRVDPTGNVGIGSTDPNDKLHVSENIRLDGKLLTDSISESTPDIGIKLLSDLRFNNNLQITASYIVFTDGTIIYALNGETGKIDFQDTDASTLIAQTIASHRKVFIRKGKYILLKPLEMVSFFTLELENGAVLEVPNGYSEHVFGLGDKVRNAYIKGGRIREAGTPKRLWQGIRLRANNHGIFFNTFQDIWIAHADIAIKLLIDSTKGWIHGNEFKSLRIVKPNICIDFALRFPNTNKISRNYFEDIEGQTGDNTAYGAKNIRGKANLFVNVKFWDMGPGTNPEAVSANIHKKATNTIIIGGLMTQHNFKDEGIRTQVIDRNRTNLYNLLIKNYYELAPDTSTIGATSTLDVIGGTGYNQLRLRTSYTPKGTKDPNGYDGSLSWDENYFYIKTKIGWKRTRLSTW